MNTSEYAGKVWATTLIVSPVLCLLTLHAPQSLISVAALGGTIFIFFIGIFFSILPAIFYILSAKGLSNLAFPVCYKKTILIFSTILGLSPLYILLHDATDLMFPVIIPYFTIGTLSTFLYPWQPEND
jgi:hypothetical protein